MKKFFAYCQCFAYITTGTVMICAVNFSLFNDGNIPRNALWQILCSSFVTTAATVFLFSKNTNKKNRIILGLLLHYCCLCMIMTGCGVWFGWIDFDVAGVITMMLSVAGVYVIAFFLTYTMDKKQTEELNQALHKRNAGKKGKSE